MSSYKVEFPQSEFKENDDGQGECDVFGGTCYSGHDGHDSHGRHDPCQKKNYAKKLQHKVICNKNAYLL